MILFRITYLCFGILLGEWFDGLLVGMPVIQIKTFIISFVIFMALLFIQVVLDMERADKTSLGGSAPSAPNPRGG